MSSFTPTQLILLDAIPLFRTGLRAALTTQLHWVVVGEGGSGKELEALLFAHHPEVALVDVRLPTHPGTRRTPDNTFHLLADLPVLRRRFPATQFLLLVENSSRNLLSLISRAGAAGCIDRAEVDVATVTEALGRAAQQEIYFSPMLQTVLQNMPYAAPMPLSLRQLAILATLAYHPARPYTEQARALHIAHTTLQNHLQRAYKRLGVSNLTAALLVAIHRGWLPPDPGVLV